jgi:class 3 adenylate cyclase/tetratricopeptide (TPR) repeat protein
MKFCGQCGNQLGTTCQVCGFVNPANYRFCGQCGSPLVSEPLQLESAGAVAHPALPVSAANAVGSPGVPMFLLEGERRLATVILVDVVGSTDILERIGTEAWVDVMNRVLQILEAEVYRFGGVVDQFRGDGLVAFFGAESAHEDDPERAVLAGMAMHRAIRPFAAELRAQDDIQLQLRVGVNTGEVIVASIGDDRHHSEDTAMGEAIALAARMESAAEPGTVLVSDNTYHLVESRFRWESLGQINVKGIRQPVSVYRPLALRPGAARVQRLEAHDLSALLVGREAEFEQLKSKVEALRVGQGGIVLLMGDTGMSKSSLIAGVRQHVVRDDALLAKADGIESPMGAMVPHSLTWLQGRSRSYAQTSPYSVWLDLLGAWLDVREDEPTTEMCERLKRQVEELWGDQQAEHYPYLATLLSLPLEDPYVERVQHLDAEGRRRQFFETLRSWVEQLAGPRPLALVLEDVHWADTTSLELLEYCLPVCSEHPILWMIVFRQDHALTVSDFKRHVEMEYAQNLTSLTLSPLTEAQSGKMIDRLIGPQVLPTETRALLLSRAEGNPYYIEEFIHALVREGVLIHDAQTGQWHATRTVESLDVPDSLQNLLMARIDRLEPEERRVLQMAAVIGPVFWSNLLQALVCDGTDTQPNTLKECLKVLQQAQLIHEHRQVPDLGVEYVFDSNLIRDAAYDRLLSVQRVSCHRRVAEALERIFGEKVLARYYSLLAFHFAQAGATRKELFYALLAAEEAREVYANIEALEYYDRALQLLQEIESQTSDPSQLYAIRTQRFEVLNGRLVVHYLMGNPTASWADAEALLPLAHQLADDPVWLIDALLQQPGVGFFRSSEEIIAGMPMAEQALQMSRELGDRRREMQSLTRLASQRYYLNDPTWQDLADHALQLARELGDKRQEAEILTRIGSVYASSDPARSMEYLEAAQPIIRDLDDKMAELHLLEVIGTQLESSDDYYRRLTECHEIELQISREIGHRPLEGKALMFCGQIRGIYLGDYEGGLALLEEALRVWKGMPTELFPLLRIAQIQVEQGRYEEAESNLTRARQVSEPHAEDLGQAGLNLVSTIFLNAKAEDDGLRESLALTSRAFTMSAENPQLSLQYQMVAKCKATAAHLKLAEITADEGVRRDHVRRALETSQVAVDIYSSFGFVRPVECVSEEVLFRHSLALKANGRNEGAARYLRRAHDEVLRKHALIPSDSRFHDTYLRNISLHREIKAAFESGQGFVDSEGDGT